MSGAKNWKRRKDLEEQSEDYYFIWEHRRYKTQLRIFDDAFGEYHIDVRTIWNRKWRFHRISGFGAKERARKYAVDITKEFPKLKQYPPLFNTVANGEGEFENKDIEEESPYHYFDSDRSY